MSKREASRMDDFTVIAEPQRVMAALAALTDDNKTLNHEISTRETPRRMPAR